MTEDPWTNEMVQARPQEYLRWKEEQQGKAERERKEREEESDYQIFREMFEARGGDPSDARSMYKRYRNDQALEAAKKLDQATQQHMRATRSREI
jgi:hypothetical protein